MDIQNQLKNSLSLLDSLKGLTFLKGIGLSFLTGLAVVISYFLVAFIAFKAESFVIAAILMLLPLVVGFYGVNAVGILNLQEAKSKGISISQAISQSLSTSHRIILLFLLAFVATAFVMFVGAIILYMCKIPTVGPWLYGLVYPVGVLLFGFIGVFFLFVFTPLAPTSIWSGLTTVRAFKTLIVMAKNNIVAIAIKSFILSLIIAAVSFFISALIASGYGYMSTLSMALLLKGSIINNLQNIAMDAIMNSGGNPLSAVFAVISSLFVNRMGYEYFGAQSFGNAILLVLTSTMVGQVAVRGICLIYLSSNDDTVDVDVQFSELKVPDGLKEGFSKAKEVASVVAAKAKEKGTEAAVIAKEKAEELAKKAAEAKALHDEKVKKEKEEARKIAEEERALEKERLAIEKQKEERLNREAEERRQLEAQMPKEELFVVCKKCNHKCSKDDKFCEECGTDL